jgi:hypothetical protein
MSDNEQASPKKAKKIHNGYHGWMKSIAKTEQVRMRRRAASLSMCSYALV